MNSLSWIVGHLASQENFYWVRLAQGVRIHPNLHKRVGSGFPASTPPLAEMWSAWQEISTVADGFLETLSTEQLKDLLTWKEEPLTENIGTLLLRNIYHYWFHIGEAHAIRDMLGHKDVPEFVSEMTGVEF